LPPPTPFRPRSSGKSSTPTADARFVLAPRVTATECAIDDTVAGVRYPLNETGCALVDMLAKGLSVAEIVAQGQHSSAISETEAIGEVVGFATLLNRYHLLNLKTESRYISWVGMRRFLNTGVTISLAAIRVVSHGEHPYFLVVEGRATEVLIALAGLLPSLVIGPLVEWALVSTGAYPRYSHLGGRAQRNEVTG